MTLPLRSFDTSTPHLPPSLSNSLPPSDAAPFVPVMPPTACTVRAVRSSFPFTTGLYTDLPSCLLALSCVCIRSYISQQTSVCRHGESHSTCVPTTGTYVGELARRVTICCMINLLLGRGRQLYDHSRKSLVAVAQVSPPRLWLPSELDLFRSSMGA